MAHQKYTEVEWGRIYAYIWEEYRFYQPPFTNLDGSSRSEYLKDLFEKDPKSAVDIAVAKIKERHPTRPIVGDYLFDVTPFPGSRTPADLKKIADGDEPQYRVLLRMCS